ncbi:MAG: cytidylyltransferase domain-containing protein [Flavobacteriaceae bacterium]
MRRKLVAALACRNQGSRLYGKPLQNLDVIESVRIIDLIIDGLDSLNCIDDIVLGISEGEDNEVFKSVAKERGIEYIIGDQIDVLQRLILCGEKVNATDIFRVTSESPFLYYKAVDNIWYKHCNKNNDATFYDDIIDGCGFEFIKLKALKKSHLLGDTKHKSELCTLYIREHMNEFKVEKVKAPEHLNRKDLRLTVDNPEDLVICRKIYKHLKYQRPQISLEDIIIYLDENPHLKNLTYPFTEEGYNTMYI